MRSKRSSLAWPKVVSLALAIVPLVMFVFVVGSVVIQSIPAVTTFGLGRLFSTELNNVFSGTYDPNKVGLLSSIWGTIVVATLALLVAFPTALATSVLATDFSFSYLGRTLEWIFGVLSGLPPIVYALSSVIFVKLFMIPKFTAPTLRNSTVIHILHARDGMDKSAIVPTDMPNSALLGGFVLALLIIPFMVPLMIDAIKNVPQELREASFGLGATRWYTLIRVVLPMGLPGIVSAAILGTLKAIGEVVIAAWVVGFVPILPNPIYDVLQRTAPLTSTAAGLLGGVGSEGSSASGKFAAVADFAGLLLLIMAFALLYLVSVLQTRLQRRLSA